MHRCAVVCLKVKRRRSYFYIIKTFYCYECERQLHLQLMRWGVVFFFVFSLLPFCFVYSEIIYHYRYCVAFITNICPQKCIELFHIVWSHSNNKNFQPNQWEQILYNIESILSSTFFLDKNDRKLESNQKPNSNGFFFFSYSTNSRV